MKKLILFLTVLFSGFLVYSQNPGSIQGTVYGEDGKTIPGASVVVTKGDLMRGGVTDLNGFFSIKPLDAGEYNVKISYIGKANIIYERLSVFPNEIRRLKNITLKDSTTTLTITVITAPGGNTNPIIHEDGGSQEAITGREIQELPEKNNLPMILKAISSKVNTSHDGSEIYFRGSRNGDAIYVIDGIKQTSSDMGIPSIAIKNITIYSGGVPAKYGDFTGGVVIVETMGYFDWLEQKRYMDRINLRRYKERRECKYSTIEEEGEKDTETENSEKTDEGS